MSLNNPRIEIATAYPDLSKDNSAQGKGVTLLGDISTDQGRIRAFVKLLSPEGIARDYDSINWDEVSHCVRATEVKFLERYFVKQINFLKARIPEMRNILTQDLGIRQSDFFSSNPEKNAKNQNHEN